MPSSRRKVKKALSSIEKFLFEHICTVLSHTIATPFLKLKCILQARHTMLEHNLSTNLSPKCLQSPSLWTLLDSDNIYYLFSGNVCSIFRVIVQTVSNLAIKEPIKKGIIGRNKRRGVSYAMILTKKFIAGYIGNVIAVNFTLYLTKMVINKRLCITSDACAQPNPYRFGMVQPAFMTTLCKSFVFRSMWFMSCYLVEPYIEPRWMKKTIRKILTYTVQYPIDTVRTRQILTNEDSIMAVRHIAQHGWSSFFDGFMPKMWQEFIFLTIGLCMESVKYRYAEWKYDISGIQKKRKGIMNLRDLCAHRNVLLFEEMLVVHGYIRRFTDSVDLYIPHTLVHLIETRFYHDTKYDILSIKSEQFVEEFCRLKRDRGMEGIDRLLECADFEEKLEDLLNERGFQNVWKHQMRQVVRRKIALGKEIHYLRHITKSSLVVAMFSCDECGKLIDDMMHVDNYCLFWECGHVWCNECQGRMRMPPSPFGNEDHTYKCIVCKAPCNDWEQYCIKLRDFESLLGS